MKICAITMVKDEADIIAYTIDALLNQGVHSIYVMDNNSEDGTSDILQDLALTLPLVVLEDEEVGYYQSRKMTSLAHMVFESDRCDAIIPFDADEFWTGVDGGSCVSVIEDAPTDHHIAFPLVDFFASSSDDMKISNPFKRMTKRHIHISPLFKVAVRPCKDLVILQGNHGAHGLPTFVSQDGIIGHFSRRSFEQWKHKVIVGGLAYQATSLDNSIGGHWRQYYDLYLSGGEDALRGVWDTYFYNVEDTITDPITR